MDWVGGMTFGCNGRVRNGMTVIGEETEKKSLAEVGGGSLSRPTSFSPIYSKLSLEPSVPTDAPH